MRNFETDLDDVFLCSDFAVSATVLGKTVQVILDRTYAQVEEGEFSVANRKPVLTAKSSDFAGVEAGTVITVNGLSWEVLSIQPDGTGISEVFLSEVV